MGCLLREGLACKRMLLTTNNARHIPKHTSIITHLSTEGNKKTTGTANSSDQASSCPLTPPHRHTGEYHTKIGSILS